MDLASMQQRMDRALYLFQQQSLATVFGYGTALWHLAFNPNRLVPKESRRVLARRLSELFRRDWDNVAAGYYPRELLTFPLFNYLPRAPEALSDAPRMFWKRLRTDHQEPRADPQNYPPYYRRRFHWQPDGWLSAHSARVYDVEVEFLFLGAADVMRRMAIPPLVDGLRGVARPRVIDLACGTARFLRQLKAAMPQGRFYGVDLSPYYIGQAREALPEASFLVENAEAIPLQSGSFDAAVSVFLFHELPADARRNVIREAHRLLAPGGRLVISDSLQRADDPDGEMAYYFDWFPATYHEPYFKGYVADDLRGVLEEIGFEVERCESHAMSKVIVGRKPLAA